MANDEHVTLLKQSVDVWNKWRDENPDIRPDLSGANLRETYLESAKLSGADLRGADLREVNLRKANLSDATNLFRTDYLSETENLLRVALTGSETANLFPTDLTGANLSGAFLPEANLFHTDLTGGGPQRGDP